MGRRHPLFFFSSTITDYLTQINNLPPQDVAEGGGSDGLRFELWLEGGETAPPLQCGVGVGGRGQVGRFMRV